MFSDGTRRRLKALEKGRADGATRFTDTELDYIEASIIARDKGTYAKNVKVMGGFAPQTPHESVHNVSACLSPAYIEIRCHHNHATWRVIRCRWCEGCKHAWRAKVRAMILKGCEYATAYMWTLTMPEYPADFKGDRFDEAQERWHNLLRDCHRRAFKFEYLRVVELQKRGTPHFHVAAKGFTSKGRLLGSTASIARRLRGFAKRAHFGYIEGKTTDFQSARLGGAGVASYMSKYLEKSEDYNALRRADGRAIRRYCRSRGWIIKQPDPTWRFTITGGFSHDAQVTPDLPCNCGRGEILQHDRQAQKWVDASRREGKWVGPLDAFEYLLEKDLLNNSTV